MRTGKVNALGVAGTARLWTISAVECYLRGCRCGGCKYEKGFYAAEHTNRKIPCQMKATVLELVRKFGRPEVSGQVCIRKVK